MLRAARFVEPQEFIVAYNTEPFIDRPFRDAQPPRVKMLDEHTQSRRLVAVDRFCYDRTNVRRTYKRPTNRRI